MCSLTLIPQRIKIIILNPTYTKLSLSFSVTETSTNIQNFELCIQVKTYTCTLEQNVPNKLGCTCTINSAIAISFLIGVQSSLFKIFLYIQVEQIRFVLDFVFYLTIKIYLSECDMFHTKRLSLLTADELTAVKAYY